MECPRARRHVHEGIKEPVQPLRLHLVQQEGQRGRHARRDGWARLIAALIANAKHGQSESRGRYAGYSSCVVSSGERAIFHLPRCMVRLLPEKKKGSLFDFFQQLVVGSRETVRRRWRRRRGTPTATAKRESRHTR